MNIIDKDGPLWCCCKLHHSASTSNAHLLPEVLVNTDTHLDLFDSESEDASDFEELIEVQANG